MVFAGITATEAEIDSIAGANVNTDFDGDDKKASLLRAESHLNGETTKNWSDWYATSPNVDVKYIITAYTASWAARDMINYDPDAIGRGTANLRLNVIKDVMNTALNTLKDKSNNVAWIEANQ